MFGIFFCHFYKHYLYESTSSTLRSVFGALEWDSAGYQRFSNLSLLLSKRFDSQIHFFLLCRLRFHPGLVSSKPLILLDVWLE